MSSRPATTATKQLAEPRGCAGGSLELNERAMSWGLKEFERERVRMPDSVLDLGFGFGFDFDCVAMTSW